MGVIISNRIVTFQKTVIFHGTTTHLPWNKSFERLIFPTKYMESPNRFKAGIRHWPSMKNDEVMGEILKSWWWTSKIPKEKHDDLYGMLGHICAMV